MRLLANLRMKNLLMDGRTISNPFWGRHTRNPLRFQYIVDFVVVELDAWDGLCVALSMLLIQSLLSSFSFLVIISLIHRSVFYPKILVQASKNCHFCSALPVLRSKSDLRLQSRRSGRIILRPIRWRFVISITRAVQESVQCGCVPVLPCLPCCFVSYVINSLPLCWSVTCSVRWSFLYHAVRNR